VVECGGRPSLSAKTFERLRVLGNIIRQELQSNEPAKLGVLGFVDDTHAPATQLLDDAVVRDGLADELERGSHWREMVGRTVWKPQSYLSLASDWGKLPDARTLRADHRRMIKEIGVGDACVSLVDSECSKLT